MTELVCLSVCVFFPCSYDLTNINWNLEEDISELKIGQDLPDLILVRKVSAATVGRHALRL